MQPSAWISASIFALAALAPAAQSAPAGHEHGAMTGAQHAGCPGTAAAKEQTTSCGPTKVSTATAGHQATGVVKKTDPATSTATIAHDPVKDLNWPAMTMKFKVKDKAVLNQLQVDKKVDFTFVQEGNTYVITAAR